MMNLRYFLLSFFFVPLISTAQISDLKIPESVQRYFQMNRLGPELISVDIIDNHESGRTIKLKIIANRNKSGKDLGFAFAAAAAIANHADRPIEVIWVDMIMNFKDSEMTMAVAPVDCTIDAIILKNTETKKWWQDCLQFL